jgi:hypothetical protein
VLLAVGATTAAADAPQAVGTHDTTSVHGAIPQAIVGRWIVVTRATPAHHAPTPSQPAGLAPLEVAQTGSGQAPLVRTIEVRREGETFTVSVHRGDLPEPLKRRFMAIDQPAGASAPDRAVLADIGAQWSALAASRGEPAVIQSQLLDAAGVRDDGSQPPRVPGARLFIETSDEYTPGTGLLRNTASYAVTMLEADRFSGRYTGAMVLPPQTGGPLPLPPVPVGLEGEFVAYRVPEPSPSLIERLLGVFSGCGTRGR